MNVGFENSRFVETVGFDYDSVDHEATRQPSEFSVLWHKLLEWLLGQDTRQHIGADIPSPKLISQRLLILTWIINPELFDDATLSELAAQLGVTKQYLSKLAMDFEAEFGLRNVHMMTPERRERYRKHVQSVVRRLRGDGQLSFAFVSPSAVPTFHEPTNNYDPTTHSVPC